jgi:hypothetical protein
MNGKKPTRKQCEIIKKYRLNPENWLVAKNPRGELHITHRESGKIRVLRV